jgi:hypothetical protein
VDGTAATFCLEDPQHKYRRHPEHRKSDVILSERKLDVILSVVWRVRAPHEVEGPVVAFLS